MNRVRNFLALGAAAFLVPFLAGAQPAPAGPGQHELPATAISEALTIPQKAADVLRSRMTYLELGEGELQEDQPDAVGRAIADWVRRQ